MNKKQLGILVCGVVVLLSLLFLIGNESRNVSSSVNAKNQGVTEDKWGFRAAGDRAYTNEMNGLINEKYNRLFIITAIGTSILMLISTDKLKKVEQKVGEIQETIVVEADKLKKQLSALETLKNEGVLTEEEYSKKRSQIISNMTM